MFPLTSPLSTLALRVQLSRIVNEQLTTEYFDHMLLSQVVQGVQKEILDGIKIHNGVENFKVAMEKTNTKGNVCAEAIMFEDPGNRTTLLADVVYKGNKAFTEIAWLIEKWVSTGDFNAVKTALSSIPEPE